MVRNFIQFSLKQRVFFQVPPTWIPERDMRPLQLHLLLKGFQVSKNCQYSYKILGFLFLVCFVLK